MKTSTIRILHSILRGSAGALILILLLVNPAMAQYNQSITPTFSSVVTTEFATPLPVASVGTTFTGYNAIPVPYITGTLYVGASGTYSATLSGVPGYPSGFELLTGVFSPSNSTPTTPLSNFFAGEQVGAGTPTTISSLTLTAGTQYSYLLLVSNGYNGTATFTMSGPGCISFGPPTCSVNVTTVPALSPGVMALLAILLVGLAAFMLAKRASAH